MIISMTGFSSTILTLAKATGPEGQAQQFQLTITLKTLNSRFFEFNCKVPYSLTFLETELLKYCKSKLHRGNVQFTIHLSDPSALTGTIEPAFNTVKAYIAAIDAIRKNNAINGDVTLSDVIKLDNIFVTREAALDQKVVEQIMSAVHTIVDACITLRKKEGLALEADLQNRMNAIREYLKQLEPRAQVVIDTKKAQLFATLETALKETGQTEATEAQTTLIYNQLERMDIHEEIVRFNTHLESLGAIIKSSEVETGKKLDFTLQELFREINTIASKCSDALISSCAINIKVELEKAREQAQNIV